MVDTVRTLAALQTLLADNVAGDISAQDVRDFLLSVYPYFYKPATEGAYDDYFDVDSSADWTALTITGTTTWVIGHSARLGSHNRGLSVISSGQSGGDANAYLKSLSGIAIGDYVQGYVMGGGTLTAGEQRSLGLVLTDGVIATSNLAGVMFIPDANVLPLFRQMSGTLTSFATGTFKYIPGFYAGIHIRITYQAANTFRTEVSMNGEDWTDPFGGDISTAFTPTHVGFTATNDGGGLPALGLFRYFHSDVTP